MPAKPPVLAYTRRSAEPPRGPIRVQFFFLTFSPRGVLDDLNRVRAAVSVVKALLGEGAWRTATRADGAVLPPGVRAASTARYRPRASQARPRAPTPESGGSGRAERAESGRRTPVPRPSRSSH